jgi:hypothetical protein
MEGPSMLGDPRWISWKLEEAQASRAFKRSKRHIDEMSLGDLERRVLLAILMVEMTARPTSIRALEWAVYGLGRCLFLPERWLPSTLGPFQMRGAPFAFERAALLATHRIQGRLYDPRLLAHSWHGAAGRERGARVGYAQALQVALQRAETENLRSSRDHGARR